MGLIDSLHSLQKFQVCLKITAVIKWEKFSIDETWDW